MRMMTSSIGSHFIKHLRLFKPSSSTLFSNYRSHQQQRFSRVKQVARSSANNHVAAAAATSDSFASPYLSVRICCPTNAADVLSETLLCFGATSTTVDEHGRKGPTDGGEVWISSTFDVGQDVKDCISRAVDSIGLEELPSYEVEVCDHTDWIKLTQESFHPVEITDDVWIIPEWRKPPNPRAVNIILNPGLAFGTGEHPTTKLCLLLLRRSIKGGESFLDYGTGSGVLAIAALKFGANLSVGFDIEPQSITAARQNAALNSIQPEKFLLSLVPSKDGPNFESESLQENPGGSSNLPCYDTKIVKEKEKFDVVIANILLHPLLDLADRIVSYAKPGATIGLSGVISEQVPTVIERYSKLLEDVNLSTMDDWACISGTKKRRVC